MLTKFSTVYAGHVDLGDMGQSATPANARRYSNEHLASVFEKTEAIARCMDEHGYSILWLAEHHFQHEGYECIPNVLMSAVHLACTTSPGLPPPPSPPSLPLPSPLLPPPPPSSFPPSVTVCRARKTAPPQLRRKRAAFAGDELGKAASALAPRTTFVV